MRQSADNKNIPNIRKPRISVQTKGAEGKALQETDVYGAKRDNRNFTEY